MSDEQTRRANHRMKLLAYLKQNRGGVVNAILASPSIAGLNYTARISELRQQGHRIETQNLGDGLYSYRLVRK